MTNKQTIDGVSRETIQRIADHCKFWIDHPYLEAIADVEAELRALLDKEVNGNSHAPEQHAETIDLLERVYDQGDTDGLIGEEIGNFLSGRAKPADQPQGEVDRLRYKAELYDGVWELATGLGYMNVTTAISTLRAKLAERDALLGRWGLYGQAELKTGVTLARHLVADTLAILSTSAEPKPRGEVDGNSHALKQQADPVLIQAVAVTREDDDEGLRLEWLLEGGIAEMEFAGIVLFAMPEANDLCDEDGSAEIYLSPSSADQPSHSGDANEMVDKVVLPERKPTNTLNERASLAAESYNSAIDDVIELNSPKPPPTITVRDHRDDQSALALILQEELDRPRGFTD